MFLSWKDITASEEGVCLRIHHQHSGLISSCLDGRHHLWMMHCVHRNAIHLQKQQTGVHAFWSKDRDLNCDKEELWEPGKNAGSFHSFWYIWIFKWTGSFKACGWSGQHLWFCSDLRGTFHWKSFFFYSNKIIWKIMYRNIYMFFTF